MFNMKVKGGVRLRGCISKYMRSRGEAGEVANRALTVFGFDFVATLRKPGNALDGE